MEEKVKISDYSSGSMAVSLEKAEILYQKLKNELLNNNKIVLDFSDVKLVITAFLNIAIGKLYGIKELNEKLDHGEISIICNDPKTQELITDVFINSKDFYEKKRAQEPTKTDNLENLINGDL